jgi:hypothetical protein
MIFVLRIKVSRRKNYMYNIGGKSSSLPWMITRRALNFIREREYMTFLPSHTNIVCPARDWLT